MFSFVAVSCSPLDQEVNTLIAFGISDFFIMFFQGKLGVPGLPGYPGRQGPKVQKRDTVVKDTNLLTMKRILFIFVFHFDCK